jgi:hypothetical protein
MILCSVLGDWSLLSFEVRYQVLIKAEENIPNHGEVSEILF